jgi:hypothetical protein
MTGRARRAGAGGAAAALLLLLTACGGGGESASADSADTDAGGLASAADTSTCVKDAHPVTSTPDGYPTSFPLPDGTVVFHVEDRGQDGVIATGVTGTPFDEVLASMNAASKSGFKVTTGETEEDDAEANWTGQGLIGRWAIKRSASCPGETVIQLLSKRT